MTTKLVVSYDIPASIQGMLRTDATVLVFNIPDATDFAVQILHENSVPTAAEIREAILLQATTVISQNYSVTVDPSEIVEYGPPV